MFIDLLLESDQQLTFKSFCDPDINSDVLNLKWGIDDFSAIEEWPCLF